MIAKGGIADTRRSGVQGISKKCAGSRRKKGEPVSVDVDIAIEVKILPRLAGSTQVFTVIGTRQQVLVDRRWRSKVRQRFVGL